MQKANVFKSFTQVLCTYCNGTQNEQKKLFLAIVIYRWGEYVMKLTGALNSETDSRIWSQYVDLSITLKTENGAK